MKPFIIYLFVAFLAISCSKSGDQPGTYYVNSISGNDNNSGTSPAQAWKSLAKVNAMNVKPGDKILFCQGSTFNGMLRLKNGGVAENPLVVSSYAGTGSSEKPVIDAEGYPAAIFIKNAGNIRIEGLELTSDAGAPMEEKARTLRYGIWVEADAPGIYAGLEFKDLFIHHIFATENVEKDGQNPTSNMGYGFYIAMKNKDARIRNVNIEDCRIEYTGHTGIRIFGAGDKAGTTYLDGVNIVNNTLENIGGPGMVPGRCENVVVRGNTVNYSGSAADPRMHNRGSGIWPWTSRNVLIEHNRFMNAWGKMDSYGCHIDFNCSNVVVQYNLSVNNAGGFVEILGNDRNCAYRYNISINDGYRKKGVKGVKHDGKVLWTSGYNGNGAPRKGPFNNYIYNNTIFVKPEYDTRFSFAPTTDGLLIANNIFYVLGESVDVSDGEVKNPDGSTMQNVIFTNNLFQRKGIVPASVGVNDLQAMFGDPQFKNAGSFTAEDYIPQNIELIKDRGIQIEKLPGDEIGLTVGLKVEKDFFGNPVTGLPDLGAVEIN